MISKLFTNLKQYILFWKGQNKMKFCSHCGKEIVDEQGELTRKELANIIYNDETFFLLCKNRKLVILNEMVNFVYFIKPYI